MLVYQRVSSITSQNKKIQDGMRHIRPTTDQKLQKEAHPNKMAVKWVASHIFGHVSLRILIESGLITLCRLVWKLAIPWYTMLYPKKSRSNIIGIWTVMINQWIILDTQISKNPHFFPGTCLSNHCGWRINFSPWLCVARGQRGRIAGRRFAALDRPRWPVRKAGLKALAK